MEIKKSLEDFTRFNDFKDEISLALVSKFKKSGLDAGDISYNVVMYRAVPNADLITIFQTIVRFKNFEVVEEKDLDALETTKEYVDWIVGDIELKVRDERIKATVKKWEEIKGLNI